LSLRTQLQASYGIYTKGDVAKDNSRTIDIQQEAEQPLGIGAAIGTVTQMHTVSDKSDQVFLTFEEMTMWGQTKQYELC
jgi:hypothetical protein